MSPSSRQNIYYPVEARFPRAQQIKDNKSLTTRIDRFMEADERRWRLLWEMICEWEGWRDHVEQWMARGIE